MMGTVRTRFAPSPTGFLHMGSARTALFNWAYARRNGGSMVLRIEDTDRERSTRESEEALRRGLEWLGIDWDEGPFRQSERLPRYAEVVEQLLASGHAYRCICTGDELEARKQEAIAAGGKWTYDGRCRDAELGADCGPHTVRLRLPEEGMLAWDDLVFGESGQHVGEIGDRIIRRSDGHPLYHLAVVVDDLDMHISHVIRGADHHPNTPFQIALYEALEARPPRFAHVPLIVGAGGKKLSKRRDPVSVDDYRTRGFLPQAVLNWLIRLGWSHGDQEVFSADEICSLFDLDAVGRSSAGADPAKLDWLGQHYIKSLQSDQLVTALLPFLSREVGREVEASHSLAGLADLLRERSNTLVDMAVGARFLVLDEIEIDEKAGKKHLKAASLPPLRDLRNALAEIAEADWKEGAIESAFEAVRARHDGLPMGKLAQPARVSVTGRAVSPGIFETLAVLGRRKSVLRIDAVLEQGSGSAVGGSPGRI